MNSVQFIKLPGGFFIIYSDPSVKSIYFTRPSRMELVRIERVRYLREFAPCPPTAGARYRHP